MTSSGLVSEELQPPPTPSPPKPVMVLVVVAVLVTVLGTVFMGVVGKWLRDYNNDGWVSTTVAVLLGLATLYPWRYILSAFSADRRRGALLVEGNLVEARRTSAHGREEAMIAMGYATAGIILSLLLMFVLTSNGAVAHTFFDLDTIRQSFSEILHGFWINVWVACVAEVLVLVLGPGRRGGPDAPGPGRGSAEVPGHGVRRRLPGDPGDHRDLPGGLRDHRLARSRC